MNKQLADNFLRNELRQFAQARGHTVIPEQANVRMADVAKVKVKEIVKHAPDRTQRP